MKKIILAFDSFKGSISADEACRTAAESLKSRFDDVKTIELPLSDGGEGLVESMKRVLMKENSDAVLSVKVCVHGPLMNNVEAEYVIDTTTSTAFMEMASASGLNIVPYSLRNPLVTTTYGVGELLIDAARRGCSHIVMGIGGSATCDGGMGMIRCMKDNGYSFPLSLDDFPRITVACDVSNPLLGTEGAARVFAPQKGATPDDVEILEQRLKEFATQTEALGLAPVGMKTHHGAGAAGGLGYGLMAYMNAQLVSGIDVMLNFIHFDSVISDADFVITGEGKSDRQTLMGKVAYGVVQRCKAKGIPVYLISGKIEDEEILSDHFTRIYSINSNDLRPLDVLMQKEVAMANLQKTIRSIDFF